MKILLLVYGHMVRLAGKKGLRLQRSLFVGLVMVIFLFFLTLNGFSSNSNIAMSSSLGLIIINTVTVIILLVMVFILPHSYLRSFYEDENETTMGLLILTNNAADVVVAKFVSMCINIFMYAFATMPIVVLCVILGGISFSEIAMRYLYFLVSTYLIVTICFYNYCTLRFHLSVSLLQSYVMMIILAILFSIVAGVLTISFRAMTTIGVVSTAITITMLFFILARVNLVKNIRNKTGDEITSLQISSKDMKESAGKGSSIKHVSTEIKKKIVTDLLADGARITEEKSYNLETFRQIENTPKKKRAELKDNQKVIQWRDSILPVNESVRVLSGFFSLFIVYFIILVFFDKYSGYKKYVFQMNLYILFLLFFINIHGLWKQENRSIELLALTSLRAKDIINQKLAMVFRNNIFLIISSLLMLFYMWLAMFSSKQNFSQKSWFFLSLISLILSCVCTILWASWLSSKRNKIVTGIIRGVVLFYGLSTFPSVFPVLLHLIEMDTFTWLSLAHAIYIILLFKLALYFYSSSIREIQPDSA